jgi:hypothetical protein
MLDLPDVNAHPFVQVADWLELEVLTGESGTVALATLADLVRETGLVGDVHSDPTDPELDPFGPGVEMAADDAAMQFAEGVFSEIEARATRVGAAYPFVRVAELVQRTVEIWQLVPCVTALVVIGNLSRYAPDAQATLSGIGHEQIFEKVVQACMRALHRGACVRFGVPREPDWPAGIDERVRRLAAELEVDAENLQNKTRPNDGDRTLDVASRVAYGTDGPGTIVLLTQCATGKHWTKKRAEPIFAKLEDLLVWNAVLVRAVAVPWWFHRPREYERQFREFGKAVILDRPRLLGGFPDQHIDGEAAEVVRDWCSAQLALLPRTG